MNGLVRVSCLDPSQSDPPGGHRPGRPRWGLQGFLGACEDGAGGHWPAWGWPRIGHRLAAPGAPGGSIAFFFFAKISLGTDFVLCNVIHSVFWCRSLGNRKGFGIWAHNFSRHGIGGWVGVNQATDFSMLRTYTRNSSGVNDLATELIFRSVQPEMASCQNFICKL